MRDLEADLKICEAATPGPWAKTGDFVNDLYGKPIARTWEESDNIFIAAARTGWPETIERAMAAEAELARIKVGVDEALAFLKGVDATCKTK